MLNSKLRATVKVTRAEVSDNRLKIFDGILYFSFELVYRILIQIKCRFNTICIAYNTINSKYFNIKNKRKYSIGKIYEIL